LAPRWVPVGRAPVAYPKYLLSGMLRCAECDMAVVAQTATRRKGAAAQERIAAFTARKRPGPR